MKWDELEPFAAPWAREHAGQIDTQDLARHIVAQQLTPDTWQRLSRNIAQILSKRYGCLHIAQGLYKLADKDYKRG